MTSMFGLTRTGAIWRRAGLFFLGVGFLSSAGYFLVAKVQTRPKVDEPVALAIKKLWSAEESERQSAKNALVQTGPEAVRPLMALLEDLIRHPGIRYAEGKNERDFVKLKERIDRIPPDLLQERAETMKSLSNVAIGWRLKSDSCELLGRLRAEEAIPILIEAMEDEDSIDSWESMNSAMLALVEIGSAAVPEIIRSIETANERAAATPFPEGEHPSDFFVKTETAKNQARAAMVLGEIGDVQALPVLEELRRSTDNGFLRPYVDRAIKTIKQKASST